MLERFPAIGMRVRSISIASCSARSLDSTVRLVNLQTGQLDMLEELAPPDAAKVEHDPHLKLQGVNGARL